MTYTVDSATNFMETCAYLAIKRAQTGSPIMAGAYASDVAHLGLMILEPNKVRCHITGAISNDDIVKQ